MRSKQLTIQVWIDEIWADAAKLIIDDPALGHTGRIELDYEIQHAATYFEQVGSAACSSMLPVLPFAGYHCERWWSWLDDIIPSGAGRRFWVENLGIGSRQPPYKQDYELLLKGSIAPIGNLRIKESVPYDDSGNRLKTMTWSIEDVLTRHSDFLNHASSMGAVGGGATGAGGEAPKYLVRVTDKNEVWIDPYQDDVLNLSRHYLVKFPRGEQTGDDKAILKAEAGYYRFLDQIGMDTIQVEDMMFFDQNGKYSLWLPRFDVGIENGKLVKYGMESVYSVMNAEAGADLKHIDVIKALAPILCGQENGMTMQELAEVWVERDLLNLCLGNADNHGRNTSILKIPGESIKLAPLYDMAPMKADPEGIRRKMIWGQPLENGWMIDWDEIALKLEDELSQMEYGPVSADGIIQRLESTAQKLIGLEDKLRGCDVPERIITFPSIGITTIEERLKRWELIDG